MSSKFVLTGLALTGLALALPASASAQLYTWRDASGTLVVSVTKPENIQSRTYAVEGSNSFRTTRPALNRRSSAYASLIDEHSARHGVSSDLVRAVIQAESAFNPMARSHKGAMGLMQLMPATAREYGVTNAYDADQNVGAGVAYLRSLLERYDGNEELALAAYNAGPGAVDKYGQTVPPYRETQAYVAKIRGTSGTTAKPPTRIHKTVEIVNGREVVRYSNAPVAPPPASRPGPGR